MANSGRAILAGTLLIAALIYSAILPRQGLWVDEVSSLARATGHSLEHPAAQAQPGMGDFQEPYSAIPAAQYRKYMQHDNPPASFSRVMRSVLISDTNPPFYYMLLHCWTRIFGTGDVALRSLSILFALACIPFMWGLGLRLGGQKTAIYACFLFAIAPIGVYYAVEGRMYSLLWLESLAFAFCAVRFFEKGRFLQDAIPLILIGAIGLLTHYYFVFVWLPLSVLAILNPGQAARKHQIAVFLFTIILILPWYFRVPESFGYWRVTADWLRSPMPWKHALIAPFISCWRLVSPYVLGNSQFLIDLLIATSLMLAALLLWRSSEKARTAIAGTFKKAFFDNRLWPWFWLLSVCLGPSLQDAVLQTSAASERRYLLGGFPVIQLLIAFYLPKLPCGWRRICLVLLVSGYLVGIWGLFYAPIREQRHFRELGKELSENYEPGDVVIVHSIPQGVLGLARYLKDDVPLASWIERLGQRKVPQDLQRLIGGHQRIILVKIHELGESAPEEDWLRANRQLVSERDARGCHVLVFR